MGGGIVDSEREKEREVGEENTGGGLAQERKAGREKEINTS